MYNVKSALPKRPCLERSLLTFWFNWHIIPFLSFFSLGLFFSSTCFALRRDRSRRNRKRITWIEVLYAGYSRRVHNMYHTVDRMKCTINLIIKSSNLQMCFIVSLKVNVCAPDILRQVFYNFGSGLNLRFETFCFKNFLWSNHIYGNLYSVIFLHAYCVKNT